MFFRDGEIIVGDRRRGFSARGRGVGAKFEGEIVDVMDKVGKGVILAVFGLVEEVGVVVKGSIKY